MKKTVTILLLFVSFFSLGSQNLLDYEQMIYQKKQDAILSYLADDMMQGRASGTSGKQIAERFIIGKFKEFGLKPYNWNYTQSFRYQDSIAIRNVVGIIPASVISDEYIVISAHYDHLGVLKGVVYNGADDNASGVTALINLAEMFSTMRKNGKGPAKNLIFVAFDGKELSMAGSEYFVAHLQVPKEKIVCDINLDMLGTDLVPLGNNPEYLIVLGNETLKEREKNIINYCNGKYRFQLDISYTFYRSREFSKLFYRLGDHYSFAKAGIPALLFTSAFHNYTYKPTDDVEIINYDILKKRTQLLFNIIYRMSLAGNN